MDSFSAQKELIKNVTDPIVFDVGAWFGDTSKQYLDLFENKVKIYAFEPYKFSYDNMVNVTKLPSNVITFNLALGNENKKIDFYCNKEPQTNSLLATDPKASDTWECDACDFVRTEKVNMTTIDDFVEKYNIEKIDILKMDTQGSEPLIIEGAKNTISQNKIKLVYTEIIIMPTYVGQKPIDEVLYQFRKNNFILYNFYGWPLGQAKQIDALFVHESYYEKIN